MPVGHSLARFGKRPLTYRRNKKVYLVLKLLIRKVCKENAGNSAYS
jgi:hypothetical protein